MGLFDFFKRKEQAEIKLLQEQLEKYKQIADIEKEVQKKRAELEEI